MEQLDGSNIMFIVINKDNYEVEYIQVDVSNHELGLYMHIVWDENRILPEHKYFDISLENDWGLEIVFK